MRRHRRRSWRRDSGDINITAFLNLMVILVPFLLITAVFSRITILELNLPPASSSEAKNKEPQLQLEVIVRKQAIEVGDRRVGLIKRIDNTPGGYDLTQLSHLLQQIKERHPDKLDASVLLESEIPYDSLVQVMDAVRVAETAENGEVVMGELFPEISIGDAPVKSMATASRNSGATK